MQSTTSNNKSRFNIAFQSSITLILISWTAALPAIGSGIFNSAHDFSSPSQKAYKWNSSRQKCAPCHVSHDVGNDNYRRGLPWNHTLSDATYRTYVSIDGAVAPQPSGSSKLCLGCHDGTIAIDDFGGSHSSKTTFIGDYSSSLQVQGDFGGGMNLGRTHPVGVVYSYDPLDPDGLHDPSEPMGFSASINDVLENGKVVCSSCHDVHNNVSLKDSPLLRAPMKVSQGAASGLCLSCHKK